MEQSKSLAKNSNEELVLDHNALSHLPNLVRDIEADKKAVSRIITDIDSKTLETNIKRNWLGIVKKSSIEENLLAIYTNMSTHIRECCSALSKTNDNLIRTLELLKVLAFAEKTLYEHVDDQVVSNNELKEILLSWFKKQGISNENVKELIETSFQRAYTLRDRINVVRKEYKEAISQLDTRICEFEEKHKYLDSEIQAILQNAQAQLKNETDNIVKSLNELYDKLYKSIEDLSSDKIDCINVLYDKINKRVEDEAQLIDEKLQEINRMVDAVKELGALTEQSFKEYEEKFQVLYEKQTKELSEIVSKGKDDLNQAVQKNKEYFDTLLASLRVEFEQEKQKLKEESEEKEKALRSSMKKMVFGAVIGTVVFSSLLSYLITILV